MWVVASLAALPSVAAAGFLRSGENVIREHGKSKDGVNPGKLWHLARAGSTTGLIVKEIEGQRRILTHVRGKKMGHGHLLSVPAGGFYAKENAKDALLREIQEEVGMDLEALVGGSKNVHLAFQKGSVGRHAKTGYYAILPFTHEKADHESHHVANMRLASFMDGEVAEWRQDGTFETDSLSFLSGLGIYAGDRHRWLSHADLAHLMSLEQSRGKEIMAPPLRNNLELVFELLDNGHVTAVKTKSTHAKKSR